LSAVKFKRTKGKVEMLEQKVLLIGGIVGGSTLVILCVLVSFIIAFCIIRRRRRRATEQDYSTTNEDSTLSKLNSSVHLLHNTVEELVTPRRAITIKIETEEEEDDDKLSRQQLLEEQIDESTTTIEDEEEEQEVRDLNEQGTDYMALLFSDIEQEEAAAIMLQAILQTIGVQAQYEANNTSLVVEEQMMDFNQIDESIESMPSIEIVPVLKTSTSIDEDHEQQAIILQSIITSTTNAAKFIQIIFSLVVIQSSIQRVLLLFNYALRRLSVIRIQSDLRRNTESFNRNCIVLLQSIWRMRYYSLERPIDVCDSFNYLISQLQSTISRSIVNPFSSSDIVQIQAAIIGWSCDTSHDIQCLQSIIRSCQAVHYHSYLQSNVITEQTVHRKQIVLDRSRAEDLATLQSLCRQSSINTKPIVTIQSSISRFVPLDLQSCFIISSVIRQTNAVQYMDKALKSIVKIQSFSKIKHHNIDGLFRVKSNINSRLEISHLVDLQHSLQKITATGKRSATDIHQYEIISIQAQCTASIVSIECSRLKHKHELMQCIHRSISEFSSLLNSIDSTIALQGVVRSHQVPKVVTEDLSTHATYEQLVIQSSIRKSLCFLQHENILVVDRINTSIKTAISSLDLCRIQSRLLCAQVVLRSLPCESSDSDSIISIQSSIRSMCCDNNIFQYIKAIQSCIRVDRLLLLQKEAVRAMQSICQSEINGTIRTSMIVLVTQLQAASRKNTIDTNLCTNIQSAITCAHVGYVTHKADTITLQVVAKARLLLFNTTLINNIQAAIRRSRESSQVYKQFQSTATIGSSIRTSNIHSILNAQSSNIIQAAIRCCCIQPDYLCVHHLQAVFQSKEIEFTPVISLQAVTHAHDACHNTLLHIVDIQSSVAQSLSEKSRIESIRIVQDQVRQMQTDGVSTSEVVVLQSLIESFSLRPVQHALPSIQACVRRFSTEEIQSQVLSAVAKMANHQFLRLDNVVQGVIRAANLTSQFNADTTSTTILQSSINSATYQINLESKKFNVEILNGASKTSLSWCVEDDTANVVSLQAIVHHRLCSSDLNIDTLKLQAITRSLDLPEIFQHVLSAVAKMVLANDQLYRLDAVQEMIISKNLSNQLISDSSLIPFLQSSNRTSLDLINLESQLFIVQLLNAIVNSRIIRDADSDRLDVECIQSTVLHSLCDSYANADILGLQAITRSSNLPAIFPSVLSAVAKMILEADKQCRLDILQDIIRATYLRNQFSSDSNFMLLLQSDMRTTLQVIQLDSNLFTVELLNAAVDRKLIRSISSDRVDIECVQSTVRYILCESDPTIDIVTLQAVERSSSLPDIYHASSIIQTIVNASQCLDLNVSSLPKLSAVIRTQLSMTDMDLGNYSTNVLQSLVSRQSQEVDHSELARIQSNMRQRQVTPASILVDRICDIEACMRINNYNEQHILIIQSALRSYDLNNYRHSAIQLQAVIAGQLIPIEYSGMVLVQSIVRSVHGLINLELILPGQAVIRGILGRMSNNSVLTSLPAVVRQELITSKCNSDLENIPLIQQQLRRAQASNEHTKLVFSLVAVQATVRMTIEAALITQRLLSINSSQAILRTKSVENKQILEKQVDNLIPIQAAILAILIKADALTLNSKEEHLADVEELISTKNVLDQLFHESDIQNERERESGTDTFAADQAAKLVRRCIETREDTLDLSGLDLSTLPSDLQKCKHLKTLNLSNNEISVLPPWFEEVFQNLTDLNLSNNRFFELPDSLSKMKKLKVVDLSHNKFEYFPQSISEMNLESLNISNNSLLFLPSDVGGMANLTYLDVSNNSLMTLPEELSDLKKLKALCIDNNKFLQSEIGNVTKIFAPLLRTPQDKKGLINSLRSSEQMGYTNTPQVKRTGTYASMEEFTDFSDLTEALDAHFNADAYGDDDTDSDTSWLRSDLSSRSASFIRTPTTPTLAVEYSPDRDDVMEPPTDEDYDSDRSTSSIYSAVVVTPLHKVPSLNLNTGLAREDSLSSARSLSVTPTSRRTSRRSFRASRVFDYEKRPELSPIYQMLLSEDIREKFRAFCVNEKAEEIVNGIDFWVAALKFKSEPDMLKNKDVAAQIYYDYLDNGCDKQLVVPPHYVQKITSQLEDELFRYKHKQRQLPEDPLPFYLYSNIVSVVQDSMIDMVDKFKLSGIVQEIDAIPVEVTIVEPVTTNKKMQPFSASEQKGNNYRRSLVMDHVDRETLKELNSMKKDKFDYKERISLLFECLESERKYVKYLHVLWDLYYVPIIENKNTGEKKGVFKKRLVSEKSAQTMFPPNLKPIIAFNLSFLKKLETRFGIYSDKDPISIYYMCIADLFIQIAPKLDVYISYLANYDSANTAVRNYKAKHKTFETWVNRQKKNKLSGGLDMSSLLIMPVQRIPRYKILLENLLKQTSPTHADYDSLLKAIEMIGEAAMKQNEKIRETNNLMKVHQIARVLKLDDLPKPNRFLIREGNCMMNEKHQKAYLFTDILVLREKKKLSLVPTVRTFSLYGAILTGGRADTISLQMNSLKTAEMKDKNIDLVFDSHQTKAAWLTDLAKTIDKIDNSSTDGLPVRPLTARTLRDRLRRSVTFGRRRSNSDLSPLNSDRSSNSNNNTPR
jgi:hypothetical protein